jgi:hypothetical protein
MDITLIKINGQGWEFPCENNWPCAVAFALGDPPDPVTEEEADQQAKLIAAAPAMLEALRYIATLDTSQDASPAQCSAVLVAMDAIDKATK